jgi:hypothetical protein
VINGGLPSRPATLITAAAAAPTSPLAVTVYRIWGARRRAAAGAAGQAGSR